MFRSMFSLSASVEAFSPPVEKLETHVSPPSYGTSLGVQNEALTPVPCCLLIPWYVNHFSHHQSIQSRTARRWLGSSKSEKASLWKKTFDILALARSVTCDVVRYVVPNASRIVRSRSMFRYCQPSPASRGRRARSSVMTAALRVLLTNARSE